MLLLYHSITTCLNIRPFTYIPHLHCGLFEFLAFGICCRPDSQVNRLYVCLNGYYIQAPPFLPPAHLHLFRVPSKYWPSVSDGQYRDSTTTPLPNHTALISKGLHFYAFSLQFHYPSGLRHLLLLSSLLLLISSSPVRDHRISVLRHLWSAGSATKPSLHHPLLQLPSETHFTT